MDALDSWLAVAENAAREAGGILRGGAGGLREVTFADRHDVKLRADTESERRIRVLLGRETPYPVVGEEEGGDASLTERYEPYWVVDPLDGTFNYLRGSPHCCVSIGLMRGETPVLGVVHDFHTGECFSGIVADGLRLNGEPVSPAWARTREEAALQTGFPSGMSKGSAELHDFVARVQTYKKVRMVGSAALALAYVAAGRADVYYESSIRLWDVAAGLALVQAAGGVVRMRAAAGGESLAYDIRAAGRTGLLPD